MNVYGYSQDYLEQEKVLNKYEAEKVIKYLQLQINEICDNFKSEFENLKQYKQANNEFNLVKSDFNVLKEFCQNNFQELEKTTHSIQMQLAQLQSQVRDEVLSQSSINTKFKEVQSRIDSFLKLLDEHHDNNSKSNDEWLKRIVNLEADVHQLTAVSNYLKQQRRELNQLFRKEISPIKNAKALFDKSRLQIYNQIKNVENKLELSCSFITNEIDNIKEPIQYQINDIKQEKDGILRELEKIYKHNR